MVRLAPGANPLRRSAKFRRFSNSCAGSSVEVRMTSGSKAAICAAKSLCKRRVERNRFHLDAVFREAQLRRARATTLTS